MPAGFELKAKVKERSYKNLYALFVGIEKFQDTNIGALYGSADDAAGLATVFRENADLHASGSHHICLLTDQEAKRAIILEKLTEYIHTAQAGDLLLCYISTHGLIDYGDYYFFPNDCSLRNILGTGISATTMTNALSAASTAGTKVLMIIDACHSGAIGFDLSKYKGEFCCMLSSSPVEYSYETFDRERSVFTYPLTQGLLGKARDGGAPTLIELFDYVYKEVQKQTRKNQNPLLMGTMQYNTVLLT